MKKLFFLILILICTNKTIAQNVGIGTTTPKISALLDITSTNKGVLLPRVALLSNSDDVTVPSPARYLIVYNTNNILTNGLAGEGLYANIGNLFTNWQKVGTGAAGTTGPQGTAGTNGQNTLIKTTVEPISGNCATGGVKQEYGIDVNNNSFLDPAEVNITLTKFICNGATGQQGTTGPAGPTGNGGIVTSGFSAGLVNAITGPSATYVFAGTPATVSITSATQKILMWGNMPIGLVAGSSTQDIIVGAGIQPSAGGVIQNMAGNAYSVSTIGGKRENIPFTGYIVPGIGSWKIGAVVKNTGNVAITDNDYEYAIYMVVDQ